MKSLVSKITIGSILILSQSSFAFNQVSEVLPNGTLLICGQTGEKKVGNKVEILSPISDRTSRLEKTGEYALPKLGSQIRLVHSELHPHEKRGSELHTSDVGVSKVVDVNLVGMDRKIVKENGKRNVTEIVKISEKAAEQIKEDCIIADSGNTVVEVGTKVEY